MPSGSICWTNPGRAYSMGKILLVILVLTIQPLKTFALARLSLSGEGHTIATYFPEGGLFEDRGRMYLKTTFSPTGWLFFMVSGYGEFLSRSQVEDGSAANFRLHETYMELRGSFVELRAGYSNVVWGVLDEIQPSDVINPLDVSWFFFEGRSKARLPIPLMAGRFYLPEDIRVELIMVPFFERGLFDQLGQDTSPFNVEATQIPPGLPRREKLPEVTLREIEYGGRISWTLRRIDFDFFAFRGREDFPVYIIPALSHLTYPLELVVVETFPRFTLLGADLETVIGNWGLRLEGAYFPSDTFQHPVGYEAVEGNSFQVGIGADRTFYDDYVLNGDLVYQRRRADGDFMESPEELNLVAGLERSFRYDLDKIRFFAVYNPLDQTVFLRGGGRHNLFYNFWIELSAGVFLGSGNDLIGRFEAADFIFLRGKYYF